MTFLARHLGVQPDQWKPHKVMVEACFLSPIVFVVALLALWPERILVRIVLLVTGGAVRLQFVGIKVARMARLAFDVFMRAAKRIFGLVVIETDRAPFGLIMAGLAFRAKTPGVNILQPVTRHAGPREIFVDLIDVARGAVNAPVSSL